MPIKYIKFSAFLGCGLLLMSFNSLAQNCNYTSLEPDKGKIDLKNFSVYFGEGDDVNKPQAWQGPLQIIQSNGTSCTVNPEASILERPFYQDGQHLLVTTYSGSDKIAFFIDSNTCKILWKSKPFIGKINLKDNILQLDTQTIKLNSNCIPEKILQNNNSKNTEQFIQDI